MMIKAILFRIFLACLLLWVNPSPASAQEFSCEETGETHIWISPLNPKPNSVIKIMAVSTDKPLSELALIDNQGAAEAVHLGAWQPNWKD